MAEKQLIVAVEGTAALGPFWQNILSEYLDKIIRCFYGNELSGQKLSGGNSELALVVFNTHGPYSAFTVQRSGWTKDLDVFFQWLSGIQFSGGGYSEAAIAEGLSEALMMFAVASSVNPSHSNIDTQKHCILVAASNPHSLPTPVYRPPASSLDQSETAETQPESCLADAETVAKAFGPCSVSLSVISPKPLPKLRAIYSAGKRSPRTADSAVDNGPNPNFLVLLSENFMEARAALSRPQNFIKSDGACLTSVPASTTAIPSVNGSMINRQTVPVGSIPPAIVKVEPTTVPSIVPGPIFSHSSISSAPSQGVQSLQTSSPPPVSQEMNATSEGMQEIKPIVSAINHSLRPAVPAAANVSILNTLSQHRLNSASIGANSIGLQTMGGAPMAMHMSNMISSGMASSAMSAITSVAGSAALMATAQVPQNTAGSFASGSSNLTGNSNLGISPALSNLQGNIGMGQSVSGMGQGTLASGAQIGQGGIGMNQNMMTNIGNGISSGPGTMIPTPGMTQASVNSLGATNNSSMNMPLQHASGVQQSQSKYVKIWEGALSGQRQGQPVFICKLEGYRNATASESLADDWPSAMQIVRLIAQDHMNNKQYVGKADFLVFRTLNQHGFLGQLQEKKLCAVIQLPSQTLLMSVSDKAGRLIGMLFPGDMVVFKPQVSSQQPQQLQQSQQHQHLQQQAPSQHLQQQILGSGMTPPQQQMVGSGMVSQQQQQQQQQQMGGSGMTPPQQQMVGSGMTPQQQQQMINSGMSPQHQQMMNSGMSPQQQLIGSGMNPPQQQMIGSGMIQQQQMIGAGMSQAFVQGSGRSQMMPQGKMSSQGPGNMSGGGFLS